MEFKNDDTSYYKPWVYYFGKQLLDSAVAYSSYKSKVTCNDNILLVWVIQWDVWINLVTEEEVDVPLYPGIFMILNLSSKSFVQGVIPR